MKAEHLPAAFRVEDSCQDSCQEYQFCCVEQVVRRTGKLAYVWQGLDHLPLLVARLKREEETGQPIGDRRGNPLGTASEHQNTHSLWALSRKFIRLLLTQQVSDSNNAAAGLHSGAFPFLHHPRTMAPSS